MNPKHLDSVSREPAVKNRFGFQRLFGIWITSSVWLLTTSSVPGGQSEDLLNHGKLLYSQQEFLQACEKLKKFVNENSNHAEIQPSLFLLGESYRRGGQIAESMKAFEILVNRFQTGPHVAESAYRLGYLNLKADQLQPAVDYLKLTLKESPNSKTRYLATFFLADALQQLGKQEEALTLYDEMGRTNPGPDTTNYLEQSRLQAARLHAKKGNRDAAAKLYDHLVQTCYSPAVKNEALLRQALAAIEGGKLDEGERLLRQFESAKGSPLEALSQVAEIFLAFHQKNFSKVISLYNSGSIITTAGEYRPQVLYMVAESLRAKGDPAGAARLYTLVEGRYPSDEKGIEAGFRKIMMLYQSGDSKLPSQVYEFTDALKLSQAKSPFIDRAYLILAEYFFFQAEQAQATGQKTLARKNYQSAAKIYSWIRDENIEKKHLPSFYFHKGWCLLETGDLFNGGRAIALVANEFPDSPLAPQAIARRGEAFLSIEDFGSARADFQAIVDHYPDSPVLEVALERLGRIFSNRRDYPRMIMAYRRLLEKFPQTRSRAEANFWIGVAYFEEESYRKAIPYLEQASQLDRDFYSNKAGIRIILSFHSLSETDLLVEACRKYIQKNQDAGVLTGRQTADRPSPVPVDVLVSTGKKLAFRKRFDDAEFFLNMACDSKNPERTRAEVWRELGLVRMALEKHEFAIEAWDSYLVKSSDLNERGLAYLSRGRSQLVLKNFHSARQSAYECLRSVRQGRINADARILIGEICEAAGDFESAAREFELVIQLFNDPNITPRARQLLVQVRRKLGLPDAASIPAGFPAAMR